MTIHREIAKRARVQHGLVRRDQLTAMGVPPATIGDWLGRGTLERLHPGVYRVGGATETWEQLVLAAALAGAGVASHRSAARIWGMLDQDHIEITVDRPRLPRLAGATVHRSRDLRDSFVTRRHGIPVTNPMRTLVDLGAVVTRWSVSDALEQAVTARVCSVLAVEKAMGDLAKKGRRGVGAIRRALDDRALGAERADGLLETRMARLLKEHGLPRPEFQYEVRLNGRLIGRVDFAYPRLRIVIEVDGFEVHGSPAALQADLERQNRLVAAGWIVLRFTWADVVRRPEWVVQQIRSVLLSQAA